MSNNGNGYMSIREAVIFTGKSERTLYRYIKQGKLNCLTVPDSAGQMPDNNKQSVRVRKEELARIFNISTGILPDNYRHMPDSMTDNAGQLLDNACQLPDSDRHMPGTYRQGLLTKDDIKEILRDNLKDVITTNKLQEFFESKQAELVKPLEQQSLVLVGELRNEVKHLRAEKEALLQENDLLRAQVKVLPDFQKEKETYKSQVEILEKEKADILSRAESIQREKEEQIRKTEGLNQVLLDNANNLKELAGEKARIEIQLKEQNSTIKEKEHSLRELHELHRLEIERLKEEAEAREKQIAEAWKKELEEARKPWWKKLW